MRAAEWWKGKAAALPADFSASKKALLLAVACHETVCGDAWPGEHNWGAATRGALSHDELTQLSEAGVVPVIAPTSLRLAAEAAATRVLGVRDDRAIHVDSRPSAMGSIPYFTWFAKFADDVAGAAYFVGFFKSAAELAALESANPSQLARAMYQAHYYTGFSTDPEVNITQYTGAITPLYAEAFAALGEVAIDWRLIQSELNDFGVFPRLKVDGIPGPLTRAAIRDFQIANDLPTTGEADEATIQALRGPEANT